MIFKSSRFKTILSSVIFIAVLSLLLANISDLVQRKNSDIRNKAFFEQTADYDVILLGTSHVMDGFLPMELWNSYGIASYNWSGPGNSIATSYWVLKNALDYTGARLVVVDVFTVGSNDKVLGASAHLHDTMDCFPISLNKVRASLDLFADTDAVDVYGIRYADCRKEFIWDFGIYHTRWNALSQNDFTNAERSLERGAASLHGLMSVEPLPDYSKTDAIYEETVSKQYLRRLIEECQARGIEVLLTCLPYDGDITDAAMVNSVYALAEEYGIGYIDNKLFNSLVDPNTDFADPQYHLNAGGAKKVTAFLGEYIEKNYDIPDRRDDPDYAAWNGDWQSYLGEKSALIREESSLAAELMHLADDDYSTCLRIRSGSGLLTDSQINGLIKNLAPEGGIKLLGSLKEGCDYLLVADNRDGSVNEASSEALKLTDTVFGDIEYRPDGPHVMIAGTDIDELCPADGEIQIVVCDPSGEIISTAAWGCSEQSYERK